MNKKANAIIVASTFLWLGFVLAISFMEAWLKFEAPNITVPLGLGISRLVFTALNLVELTLIVVILGSIIFSTSYSHHKQQAFFYIPVIIVIIQTVWMLPVLDILATEVMAGNDVGTSMMHLCYIAIEFVKVLCLFIYGCKTLNLMIRNPSLNA